MSATHIPASDSLLDGFEGPDAAGVQKVDTLISDDELRPGNSDLPDPAEVAVDPFQKYLNEISAIPLLSKEEEKALAERVRLGVEARSKLEQKTIKGNEVEKLRKLDTRGKMAGRLLFQANLRFVVHVAKRYRWSEMSMMDLIQEGNIGLLSAVEKFDNRKGTRFSTYAAWWIKQAIGRAVARQARPVRLPEHTIQSINDIKGIRQWLAQEEDREANCAEIALELGLLPAQDAKLIKKALDTGQSLDAPLAKRWQDAANRVSALLGMGREKMSSINSGEQENSRTLEEELGDGSNPDPLDIVYRQQMKRKLLEIMGSLSDLECKVLQMRFGLADGGEMTVDEVAEELNIKLARVKQLETKALRSLRHPNLSGKLKELLK